MGGKGFLRHKGKTLLGIVNKLVVFKSLLTTSCNVLPWHFSRPWIEFSLKVKVMGSNPGYLLKSFLLYCLIYIQWVSWTRRFARVTIQNTDCVRGSWRDSPFEKIEATKSHRRTPPALHTLTKMNGNQTTHFSLLGIEHNRDKLTEISITNFAFGYIDVIKKRT